MVRARDLQFLAVCLLVAGVVLLVVAGLRGDAELFIFLIFPVISGSGATFAVGTLLLVLGIFLSFLAFSLRYISEGIPASEAYIEPSRQPRPEEGRPPPREGGPRWGGVVFIGPIPIVFGSSSRTGLLMVVAAIVMAIFLIVFILGALWL